MVVIRPMFSQDFMLSLHLQLSCLISSRMIILASNPPAPERFEQQLREGDGVRALSIVQRFLLETDEDSEKMK
jgi:hypothetical protein